MREKGITLIALIVTIIVLVILAGVSIRAFIGNNGLVEPAVDAGKKIQEEQEKEIINLSYATLIIDNMNGKITTNTSKEEIAEKIEEKMMQDGYNVDVFYDETELGYVVTYTETNNSYIINKDSSVEKISLTSKPCVVKFYDDDEETLLAEKTIRTGKTNYKAPNKQDWENNYTFDKWLNKDDKTVNDMNNIDKDIEVVASYLTTYNLKIGSTDDFKTFRDKVNSGISYDGETITLNSDLNLNCSQTNQWTPIGTKTNPFNGILNGNGKTISGLYINNESVGGQALFGYVGDNGEILNLTLSGSTRSKDSTGGIAFTNYGEIKYCVNNANVSSKNCNAGGIVAWNFGIVYRCINNGNITTEGQYNAAGIAAFNGYYYTSTSFPKFAPGYITECINNGKITSNQTTSGGICALSGANPQGKGMICNCYNTNTVTSPIASGINGSVDGEADIAYSCNCFSTIGSGTLGTNWKEGNKGYTEENMYGSTTNPTTVLSTLNSTPSKIPALLSGSRIISPRRMEKC